jgi:hypothetical protein
MGQAAIGGLSALKTLTKTKPFGEAHFVPGDDSRDTGRVTGSAAGGTNPAPQGTGTKEKMT